MNERIINYYTEIPAHEQMWREDKVLFNGRYRMERKVAIKNLKNKKPIMFWALNDFKYTRNRNERFDVNCAVKYNVFAKFIHRRIMRRCFQYRHII